MTIKAEGGIKMSKALILKKIDLIEEKINELYRMAEFELESWPVPEQLIEEIDDAIEAIRGIVT